MTKTRKSPVAVGQRRAKKGVSNDVDPSLDTAPRPKVQAPKLSRVEKLLDAARKNPSRTCRDPKQLDLIEFAAAAVKRQAFAVLDEVISETLAKGGKP